MKNKKSSSKLNSLINKIEKYLSSSKNKYNPNEPEYGCRLALEQAKLSLLKGNYGVGAALFVYKTNKIEIFLGQNKIVTGIISDRFNTHAETDAIKKWLAYLEGKIKPDSTVTNDKAFSPQVVLYVTLEPCPKCEIEITLLLPIIRKYFGTNVRITCISCVADGELIRKNGLSYSSGGAHALGKKHETSPLIWRNIQSGNFQEKSKLANESVRFQLLQSSDNFLPKLSWEIFTSTRKIIDQLLAGLVNVV